MEGGTAECYLSTNSIAQSLQLQFGIDTTFNTLRCRSELDRFSSLSIRPSPPTNHTLINPITIQEEDTSIARYELPSNLLNDLDEPIASRNHSNSNTVSPTMTAVEMMNFLSNCQPTTSTHVAQNIGNSQSLNNPSIQNDLENLPGPSRVSYVQPVTVRSSKFVKRSLNNRQKGKSQKSKGTRHNSRANNANEEETNSESITMTNSDLVLITKQGWRFLLPPTNNDDICENCQTRNPDRAKCSCDLNRRLNFQARLSPLFEMNNNEINLENVVGTYGLTADDLKESDVVKFFYNYSLKNRSIEDHKIDKHEKDQRFREIFLFSPKGKPITRPSFPLENVEGRAYWYNLKNSRIYTPVPGYLKRIFVKNCSEYQPLCFSKTGGGNGELNHPWGILVTVENNIVVSDRINHRIQIFDKDGRFVRSIGSYGDGFNQFNRPTGMTVDHFGRLLVVDKDNHRVQILSNEGEFVGSFGTYGTKPGQFEYPWDASCSYEIIAVTDSKNARIQLFNCADFNFIKEITEVGSLKLKSPRGISWGRGRVLVVSDFSLNCVLVMFMGKEGVKYSRSFYLYSHPGTGYEFQRPQGITVDSYNNIIVADSKSHRIQVFNMIGEFLFAVGGQQGAEVGSFNKPCDVALTPQGRIAIVDQLNNRVQIV